MQLYPDVVNDIAKYGKYLLALAATALTAFSLSHETTYKSDDPTQPRLLNPAGRRYRLWLVVIAMLTFATAVVGDRASDAVADHAKTEAENARQNQMTAAMKKQLMDNVNPLIRGLETTFGEAPEAQKKAFGKAQDTLKTDVEKTSGDIRKQLYAESDQSTQTIHKMQVDLAQETQDSATQLKQQLNDANQNTTAQLSKTFNDSAQQDLKHSNDVYQRETTELEENAKITEDAPRLVDNIRFTLSFPPGTQPPPVTDPTWEARDAESQQAFFNTCRKGPNADPVPGPRSMTCAQLFQSLIEAEQRNPFAKRLFAADHFNTKVAIVTDNFRVVFYLANCVSHDADPKPTPCTDHTEIFPISFRGKKRLVFNSAVTAHDNSSITVAPAADLRPQPTSKTRASSGATSSPERSRESSAVTSLSTHAFIWCLPATHAVKRSTIRRSPSAKFFQRRSTSPQRIRRR
jgi:hypothetical protein